jgi:hypothetical protein
MPYYRLVDQETRKSVAVRRMSHEIAALLNTQLGELGDDQQWKHGLEGEGSPRGWRC